MFPGGVGTNTWPERWERGKQSWAMKGRAASQLWVEASLSLWVERRRDTWFRLLARLQNPVVWVRTLKEEPGLMRLLSVALGWAVSRCCCEQLPAGLSVTVTVQYSQHGYLSVVLQVFLCEPESMFAPVPESGVNGFRMGSF